MGSVPNEKYHATSNRKSTKQKMVSVKMIVTKPRKQGDADLFV
jgi:hypothetical protein